MKKFTILKKDQKTIMLNVHELKANEKIADFNFFVLNSSTGFGLYQHYHHSCSLNTFNNFIKSNYNEFRKKFAEDQKKEHEEEGKSKTEIKQLMKNYQGNFKAMII